LSNTPSLSSFTGSVLGKTVDLQWAPVSASFVNSYEYDLEYKLSTESTYSMLDADMDYLEYKWASKVGNTTYNFRLRPKLRYKYVSRTMTGTRTITGTRVIAPNIDAIAYGSYYILSSTVLYNYYVKGYNSEYIEIPNVFVEELEDDTAELNRTLGGLYIRNQQNGTKNIITLETRPSEREKCWKLYSLINREWTK